MSEYVCERLVAESSTGFSSIENREKTTPNQTQCNQRNYDEDCNHRRSIIPKVAWNRNEWDLVVCASIKRSYLELEVADTDIGVGVNEKDKSEEVGMTLEEINVDVDGGGLVTRKIGLLLLLLAVEEKVKVVVVMVLLLGSILVTVSRIDEVLQNK
jgi:hypothetical protein